jgi:hypothetical protein
MSFLKGKDLLIWISTDTEWFVWFVKEKLKAANFVKISIMEMKKNQLFMRGFVKNVEDPLIKSQGMIVIL